MTKEQLKSAADAIRAIADEIESGRWGSVNWEIVNDLEDEPRFSWERPGAKLLVGRTVTIRLALPTEKS